MSIFLCFLSDSGNRKYLRSDSTGYSSSSSVYSCSPSQLSSSSTEDSPSTGEIVKQIVDTLSYDKLDPNENYKTIDARVYSFFEATIEACVTHLSSQNEEQNLEACVTHLSISKEEQNLIGPLIKTAIPDMDNYLQAIGEGFDPQYGPKALIVRSGYEFMRTNFGEFPDGKGGTLKDAFKYFDSTQSIVKMDRSLAEWKECPYTTEDIFEHPPEELNRPAGIPESHYWWFEDM